MKYFFRAENLRDIRRACSERTLYAFDFDGTLAALHKNRSAVKMPKQVATALTRLTFIAPVAIISGRSVSDLAVRLGSFRVMIIGNHGLESGHVPHKIKNLAKVTCREWKRSLLPKLPSEIDLEDKIYSLTLHGPQLERDKKRGAAIYALIKSLEPRPRIIIGKSSINLLVPGSPHKGDALAELARRLKVKRIVYAGDDVTDEFVFRLPRNFCCGVRVGRNSDSQAPFFLRSQREILAYIRTLSQFEQNKREQS